MEGVSDEPAAATSAAAGGNGTTSSRRKRRKQRFDQLSREMEVATFPSGTTGRKAGQARRVAPKSKALERTNKRKTLDREDKLARAIVVDGEENGRKRKKRMRGPKMAMELGDNDEEEEEAVVDGTSGGNDSDDEGDGSSSSSSSDTEEDGEDEYHRGGKGSRRHDRMDTGEDEEEQEASKGSPTTTKTYPHNSNRKGTRYKKLSGQKMARSMYRLQNFSSYKLAQHHGDALSAYARNHQHRAVTTLSQVARAAPIAPQVYSSLGLVYENLLLQQEGAVENGTTATASTAALHKKIELGKKAYGSYHVAAVLCKKDYTLWVHAGDAASDLADLYAQAMMVCVAPHEQQQHEEEEEDESSSKVEEEYRTEHKRWLNECQKDYHAADKLHPPGIEIPCKLAAVHVQLGNYADALTILTDVTRSQRQRGGKKRKRSELDGSYGVWTLYADLMLRIGHECVQFARHTARGGRKGTSGSGGSDNYMFKRWLRKHATTFQWRERRLDALCRAMEAAAGAEACGGLARWRVGRAAEQAEAEQAEEDSAGGRKVSRGGRKRKGNSSLDGNDEEGHGLDDKDEEEDDDDEEEGTDGSKGAVETSDTAEGGGVDDDDNEEDRLLSHLPMSASCSTVCGIASQLMKHCLALKLYDGSCLVGEAVSSYFKGRAARRARRRERRVKLDRIWERRGRQQQQLMMTGAELSTSDTLQGLLDGQEHDEVNDDSSDDSDEDSTDQIVLSDDDTLDDDGNATLIESMEQGILPPDLQFLYGTSLILSEGAGKDYAANALLQASLRHLPVEECSPKGATSSAVVDVAVNPDPAWIVFLHTTTGPLGCTAALSLVSDLLRNQPKNEGRWCDRLLPMLENHVKLLDESRALLCHVPSSGNDDMASLHRSHHMKLLLALARMRLHVASRAATRDENGGSERLAHSAAIKHALSSVSLINRFHSVLWSVPSPADDVASVSLQRSVEMLRILSRAFSLVIRQTHQKLKKKDSLVITPEEKDFLKELMSKLSAVVSFVFNLQVPTPAAGRNGARSEENRTRLVTQEFPLPCDWQNELQRNLSRCIFYLCLGATVTSFSGWDEEEFSVDVLRNRYGSNYFGVKVDGPQIAGHLHGPATKRLSHLWKCLRQVLPGLPTFDFDGDLAVVQRAAWYRSARKKLQTTFRNERVASHGEDYGIDILTSFSELCLIRARFEENDFKEGLIKNSLSVALPLSQFCLDQTLWLSSIGEGATADEDIQEWEDFIEERSMFAYGDSDRSTRSRPKAMRTSLTAVSRNRGVRARTGQSWRRPVRKRAVCVPASFLLREWTKVETQERESASLIESEGKAKLAMKKVDYSVRQLRACYTMQALQRASIQVAAALLDAASEEECYNPFLCLHQAAIFAGQGPKGGNSDEPFKRQLPGSESDCSALEALLILGRADCLRATAFTDEALFLCSYVVRLCHLHRSEDYDEFEWNAQWRAVGIQAYVLSVAIDASIASFLKDESGTDAESMWDSDVRDEIKRGEFDAISLARGSIGMGEGANEALIESDNDVIDADSERDKPYSDYDGLKTAPSYAVLDDEYPNNDPGVELPDSIVQV